MDSAKEKLERIIASNGPYRIVPGAYESSLKAIRAAGFAIVPRAATDTMIAAADEAGGSPDDCWTAMLVAGEVKP